MEALKQVLRGDGIQMTDKGYCTNQENLADYLALCSLYLSGLEQDIDNETLTARAQALDAQIARKEGLPCPEVLTFPTLWQRFRLNGVEAFCVLFAFCCELDGGLRSRVRTLTGSPLPTFDLALALCRIHHSVRLETAFRCADLRAAPLGRLFRREPQAALHSLMDTPLLLRTEVVRYLTGGGLPQSQWYQIEPPSDNRVWLPLHQEVFQSVLAGLAADSPYAFFLSGEEGSGRRSLIQRACDRLGRYCLTIDLERLKPFDNALLEEVGRELDVALTLSGGVLCLLHYTPTDRSHLETLLGWLCGPPCPLFLLTGRGDRPHPFFGYPVPLGFPIGPLTGVEYDSAWAAYGCPLPEGEMLPAYRLTVGQIVQVWGTARHLSTLRGTPTPCAQEVADGVRALYSDGIVLERSRLRVRLEQLVLPSETAGKLRLLCGYARQEQRVYQEWGFKRKLAYGRGITALFCGEPGTGKTMAANAVAEELGMPLLRVDLSQTLDKYIGETEKKLERIFSQARDRNAILFFDEADALFSRRTEVTSSHDRYANAETSFLLQAIEQHEGMVLLATNLMGSFDAAFLRRIRLVIRFPMPDEALRLTLWQSAFPSDTPLDADLDFALLAREIRVSPATIQNAALASAVLAAEEGQPVGLRHLLFAIRSELEKYGQSGELSDLEALLV